MGNNVGLACFISFLGGAALSGLAVWKILDKKYKDRSDEEIASVKEHFTVPKSPDTGVFKELKEKHARQKEEAERRSSLAEEAKHKPNIIEYTKTLKENGYVDYSTVDPKKDEAKSGRYPWDKSEEEKADDKKPHVIEPEYYGENEEYDQVSMTLYADGILAYDDGDVIVEDEERLIGDALEHMGEFEDDAIHVIDKEKGIYYEILADERKYQEATHKKPHLDDGEDE